MQNLFVKFSYDYGNFKLKINKKFYIDILGGGILSIIENFGGVYHTNINITLHNDRLLKRVLCNDSYCSIYISTL